MILYDDYVLYKDFQSLLMSSPRGTHVNCFEAFDRDSENFLVRITFDNIFEASRSNVVQILTGHSLPVANCIIVELVSIPY